MSTSKLKKMGKLQRDMYYFACKYREWHTIANDCITRKVAKSLINRGLIEINNFNQIKLIKDL